MECIIHSWEQNCFYNPSSTGSYFQDSDWILGPQKQQQRLRFIQMIDVRTLFSIHFSFFTGYDGPAGIGDEVEQ